MRKILSSFLYFLPLKEPLGFSLSLLCSFQSGVGTNTPQPRPGFEARNIHPQSHSVGLQARPVTHHLSNISTSTLKLKVIGTNSDAGTHAFGMNYQHMYPCIPLHPLVRERLKAATCIQKINCQITLLLQPAATVTQKITKAPSFIVIFNSHRKKKKKKITAVSLLIFKFQALHPKLSYLKLCSSLSIQPKGLQHLIMFSTFSAIHKFQVIPIQHNLP